LDVGSVHRIPLPSQNRHNTEKRSRTYIHAILPLFELCSALNSEYIK